MKRTQDGGQRARMALGPLAATHRVEVTTPRPPLDLLTVRGHSRVILTDADGPHDYGELAHHPRRAVEELDAWLDSLDAANEDADGRLPHQRPAVESERRRLLLSGGALSRDESERLREIAGEMAA